MPKKLLVSSLLLALVVSCSHTPKKIANRTALRITLFHCGEFLVRDISMFSPGVDQGKKKVLTNTCYLIEHPKGRLIWDTGINDELALKPNGEDVMDGKFHVSLKKALIKQLVEIGVRPADIDFLGLSHFHHDHIGNAPAFPYATLLVQKAEFDFAFSPEAEKYPRNKNFLKQLRSKSVQQLQGDFDVFGDGTVLIKSLPGHTPGHQALFVSLKKTGPILLSGDLYHFTKNRRYKRVPSFNWDKKATLASMKVFEKFAKEKQAKVWIQHDYEQNQKLLHAPQFYE